MAVSTFLPLLAFVVCAKAVSFGPPEAPDKYTANDEGLTYFEANLACIRHGQELVSIESVEEWQTIYDLLRDLGYGARGGELLWTSGNSLQEPESKKFYWMSDGSAISHDQVFWTYGEPNNADGNEDCIVIGNNNGFGLNDFKCDQRRGYMCESNEIDG